MDGLAASIASVIAMAGDEIIMSDGSMMMIHNPMSIVIGESDDMRKEADLLDQVKGQLVNIYATKTGMERTRVAQMMDDETWMTDSEAVELGFADKQTDDEAEIMDFDLSRFNNVPDDLEAREKNDGLNIRAIERALTREAGLSRNEALDLMHGSSVDDLVAMREAGTEKVDWSAFAQRWRNAT